MIFANALPTRTSLQNAITAAYRRDETTCIDALLPDATFSDESLQRIHVTATQLVKNTRQSRKKQDGLDAFLHTYDLSTEEGIALMCLAEALLRIPDKATRDRLIRDKISTAHWLKHFNKNNSLFVNAATLGLFITGKLYKSSHFLSPIIQPIIMQSMKQLGKQFVMGTTIEKALKRAESSEARGYRYSYDMLGEAAKTCEDAENYFASYQHAINAIGNTSKNLTPITGPGISVKLSALHPRYELAKRDQVLNELTPRLLALAKAAKTKNIGVTVDAEEAERVVLSLEIIEKVFRDEA